MKARLLRHQKALEKHRRGGAAHDVEYLHNVMLQWFCMQDEGRQKLFPAIGAHEISRDLQWPPVLPRGLL